MLMRRRQQGIALITAIFVVTLAAIAAVAMVEASNISIHRSANVAQSEAEWWYASGVEAWCKNILVQSAKQNKNNKVVGLGDAWAQPVSFLPIDGGGIRGHMDDLQGRFNLNNLGIAPPTAANPSGSGDTPYTLQFERLLENLPDFDASKYKGMAFAIRDWVDGDDQRSGPDGAEDSDYQSQDPAYRAANQPMRSVSELLLVRGMTKELYAALLPYVAALPPGPSGTKVNINTAPIPVLLSLASGITNLAAVREFDEARKGSPISDPKDVQAGGKYGFLPPPPAAGQPPQPQLYDYTSSYFGLQAEVYIGSGRLALYSVIYRPSSGSPVVLARSTNTQ